MYFSYAKVEEQQQRCGCLPRSSFFYSFQRFQRLYFNDYDDALRESRLAKLAAGHRISCR